jgi:hypothetical protein
MRWALLRRAVRIYHCRRRKPCTTPAGVPSHMVAPMMGPLTPTFRALAAEEQRSVTTLRRMRSPRVPIVHET